MTPREEEILKTLQKVLYSNLNYQVVGNRSVLAANVILNQFGIYNIDSICSLAKVIEQNSGLEINDTELRTIYRKVSILNRRHVRINRSKVK